MLTSRHFWLLLLPSHILAAVGLLLLMVGSAPLRLLFLTLAGWIFIGGFGIAIGYHRLLSHRSFLPRKGLAPILYYLGALGGQGTPLTWAALHRAHHPFADTNEDPHSPVRGWISAYITWQFKVTAKDIRLMYTRDLLRDPWVRGLHKYYEIVVWGTILIVALISWKASLFGIVLPMVLSIHLDNLVNMICHIPRFGYRNFEVKDDSVNVPLLGWFNFGGGWHNNHHAHPGNYDFGGQRWFEFDICRILVPLVAKKLTRQ